MSIVNSTGHQGMHGHEFLEFEYSQGESCHMPLVEPADHVLVTDTSCLPVLGRLRYANNSNYRNDSLIRKESMYRALVCCPCLALTVFE